MTELRLSSRPVPRGSLLGRLCGRCRPTCAWWWRLSGLRAADGILFTGSPPFLIHLLAPLKLLWKGRLVYRITDFHPECLIAARVRPSRALGLLLALDEFLAPPHLGFEVLGEDQYAPSRETGVRRLASPWCATARRSLSPAADALEPLPEALARCCVLLYSGNYGMAHEVDTVAEGYARHRREGTGRVRLWLSAVGVGAETCATARPRKACRFIVRRRYRSKGWRGFCARLMPIS